MAILGHYLDHLRRYQELKRNGELGGAAALILQMIDAVEAEALANNWSPAKGLYRELAIVYRKVKGIYHSLYWPSYFDGGRAIHGWEDVPTYNASHGCIRFPFWNAIWIYHQAVMGTIVRIYH